ncbi:unnamed protein product [Paramecium octaurelia]|uniref:NACHT domain-containing protein n=1 Tax=Paramecium octaurelia TaxID=43137 RepID=A0A8S1VW45_PAROT|nr:unnamed protein product [Paramecium octaurelia]
MIIDFFNNNQRILPNKSFEELFPLSSFKSLIIQQQLLKYSSQYPIKKFVMLRGGGCGSSKSKKNLDSQLQQDQNYMSALQLPENYLTNLNNYLKLIVDEAQLICETTKRNEQMKRIQWFIHNREYLNYYCNDKKEGSKIYELVKANFEGLLTVLITYLRNSGFICYQVLQICNELLRIIYIFQFRESKRLLKNEDQQDYIQKLSEFETQLEIEQANVWKTGLEFEIKIMKIMIMNSKTDSTEGNDALINFFKEAGKSIIALSPSEDLLQTVMDGGKYLLKKGIEKKLYPIETYQIYYLFQLIKWSIIRQLKSKLSIYKQIQQLKDVFQQYILVSDNWILHFSWIQMIMDVIAYRPIINKSNISKNQLDQQFIKWNLLIENNLIYQVSYNKNQAIMSLFQDQEKSIYDNELISLLDVYSKKKFVLFSQFLLKGDLTQNLNLWDHYKDFSFKQQKDKKQQDYEIILASYELDILQKLINNIKSQKDELFSIHSEIIQSFQTYIKEPTQISIQIIQDHQQASQKQFLQTYTQLIILTNYFIELTKFEIAKLNLLSPYLNQFENKPKILEVLKEKIVNFQSKELTEFFNQLLNYFQVAIEFSSLANEMNLFLDSKNQDNFKVINDKVEIDKFQNIFTTFENQFNQLCLNLTTYKEQFIKSIQQKEQIKSMAIQVEDQNILSIISYNKNGEQSINKKLQEIFMNNYKFFDSELVTLENVQSNLIQCRLIILTLQYLKQFANIQSQYLMIIKQQLENYNNTPNLSTEKVSLDNKQTVFNILILQQQKIKALINENIQQPDQQIIDVNLKSLLSQIESDFICVKSQSELVQNQNNAILKLFTNAQFLFLQVLNKNEKLPILQDLLKDYETYINDMNQSYKLSIQEVNKYEDVNNNKEPFNLFDQCFSDNQKLIQNIKETKKYYKYYEKLINFQLELLPKSIIQDQVISGQDQQRQGQGRQPIELNQEEKLKLNQMREKFFNKNVKDSIEKLISSFNPQSEQQNSSDSMVNLNFTQFLQFFYSLSNAEYKKVLKPDKINDSIWLDIKNAYNDTKEKLLDLVDLKPDYKVREGFVYNLIRLQHSIQEQKVKAFCCKHLQYIWVFEKDQRVRNLLKNKELVEIQKQLFAQDIDNLSGSIKDELKQRMLKLENLQQEIKLEGNLQKREELQIQLKKTYDELDESLDNISEMSEAMDISLVFLKDISKDVKLIKASIDNLQESINQVGDDIRKLRGKRYDELLEIRKQKILLQSKLTEVDSVYVQLTTIEYDPISGEIVNYNNEAKLTKLMCAQWNAFEGEVNEFIWGDKQKDVMLLSGNAGSGKSKAARKIEEFIWKQKGVQSKWIPIYVSLPTLKNPKFNLFEQALETENYQFDKYQVKEFKEAIQAKKEFIILILDSYDEMKQDCIQSNLILTNKLIQEFNSQDRQMKVIITTRKEILNTVGYQTWFYGESLQSLKEVQLQNFNEEQQNEYLNQYVELSIKRKIKEIYEFVKQIAGQGFDLDEFLTIWGLISSYVKTCIENSKGMDGIFYNNAEEWVITKIKTHKTLEILKEEQTTTLRKDLLALWSVNKFKSSIKSVNIENLLTTPFMLEIVVQVLPNMAKKYSRSQQMKEIFIQNYLKLKKQVRISKIAREQYQKENSKFKNIEQQNLTNFDDEYQPAQEKEEEYQLKIEKTKINQIVDMLDNENFFSKYSIVSQLKQDGNAIIVDNTQIRFGSSNDINFVIMALQMKRFTVFEFYESFINFYHEQQTQKQRELGKVYNQDSFAFDIYQFSYSLAIDMTVKELSQVGYKPLGKLDLKSNYKIQQEADDCFKQYFDVEDEYKKLIRSCILLSAKGSTFSFTHKSIQEFFVAKYIYDFLLSLKKFDKENLEKIKEILQKSVFNNQQFNISTDNFRGAIYFLRDQLINVENINSKLIEIVKLSKDQDSYSRAASNSIYLLSSMNVYLGSQDFNSINLANTDISGLSLFDCDLSNSNFQNVEINSCNMNLADLSNVKWTNIICKEKPHLQGHKNEILEVQFSPDGKFIVSIEFQEQTIKLWDAEKYSFMKDLEGHTNNVNSLSFCSDSSILYSGSDDCKILRWDLSNAQQIKSEVVEVMDNQVKKIKVSQDSKKLYIIDSEQCFQILDLSKNGQTQDCVFEINPDDQLVRFALHPKEPKVALLHNNYLELRDYEKNQSVKLECSAVYRWEQFSIIFSDDGEYFGMFSQNEVIVWNLKQNVEQPEKQLVFQYVIILNSLQFSQDNELIICGQNFMFRSIKDQFIGKQKCTEAQISPKGDKAAIAYENTLSLININNQELLCQRNFSDLQPGNMLFSKDGSKLSLFLNTEGVKKQFMILDVYNKLTNICFIPFWDIYWISYVLSNDFETLYVSYNNSSKFPYYNFSSYQLIANIIKIDTKKIHKEIENKKYSISSQKFCAQTQKGVIAYTTEDNKMIQIYDLDKNLEIQNPTLCSEKKIKDFLFSPTQNELAIMFEDELQFWNLDSKSFKVQNNVNLMGQDVKSINYSPDGSLIVLILENQFQIYKVKSEEPPKIFQCEGNTNVSISLENDIIGYYQNEYYKKNVILINTKNKSEQKILEGHKESIIELRFTRDQKSLITASQTELIQWDLSTFKIKDQKQFFMKGINLQLSYHNELIALFSDHVVELWKYSQDQLIFIASQFFDFFIGSLSFLYDGYHILIQIQNQEFLLYSLDTFQFQQIYSKSFKIGTISTNNLIALVDSNYHNLSLYQSNLEKPELEIRMQGNIISYLKFLENKKNLILFQESQNIYIYDYNKEEEVYQFKLFLYYDTPQLQLQGDLLISGNGKHITFVSLSDLSKIEICGYHNDIDSFSIQHNQEFGLGIKNEQLILIKDLFNVQFALPINSNDNIRKGFVSSQNNIYIVQEKQIQVQWMNTKQIHEFKEDIRAAAYCNETDQIAICTQSQLILLQFQKNSINIVSKFDLQMEIYECKLTVTSDGSGLTLNKNLMIQLFSITKNQKIICRGMYDKVFVIKGSLEYSRQLRFAQLFYKHGTSNSQQHLAILDQDVNLFRILNFKSLKQIVQINFRLSYKQLHFQLSPEEDTIFFVLDDKVVYSLDMNSFGTQKVMRSYQNLNLSVIEKDFFVYVESDKIAQYQVSTKSSTEITTIEDITYFNYLPQQQLLSISTKNNNIIFWDIKAKKNVGTLKGHQDTITCLTVSPTDGILASASKDRLIKLWAIKQNESFEIQQAHSNSLTSIAYSQDGQLLASASDTPIFLWDVVDKKLITQLKKHETQVQCLEFSHCSKYLVSGDKDGVIIFWNIEIPQVAKFVYIIDEYKCPIHSINISKQEQKLLVIYNQNILIKWNFEQIEKQQKERALCINTDSNLFSFIQSDQIIYQKGDQLKILNFETQEEDKFEFNLESEIKQISCSEDGNLILCLKNSSDSLICFQKNNENLWSQKSISIEKTDYISLSPDKKFLFSTKSTIDQMSWLEYGERWIFKNKIYDFQKLFKEEKKILCELQKIFNNISSCRIFMSYDLTLIAVVINDRDIKLFDINNQQNIKEFKTNNPIYIQISRDLKYLACLDPVDENKFGKLIIVWDINDPSKRRQLLMNECLIKIYIFSSKNSNKIYALYQDRTVREWDITTEQSSIIVTLSESFDINNRFVFSQNLKFLACFNQTSLFIWDFQNKEQSIQDCEKNIENIYYSQNEDIFAVAMEVQELRIPPIRYIDVILLKGEDKFTITLDSSYVYEDKVSYIWFSHDDQHLVICLNIFISLYQIKQNLECKRLGFWTINQEIDRMFFNPKNMNVLMQQTSKNDIALIILDPTIIREDSFGGQSNREYICCYSPDSRYLANFSPHLKIYDLCNLQNQVMKDTQDKYYGGWIQFQSKDVLVLSSQEQLQILGINMDKEIPIQIINNYNFEYPIDSFTCTKNHILIQFNLDIDAKRVCLSEFGNFQKNLFKAIYNTRAQPILSQKSQYFCLCNYNKIQILNIQHLQQEICFEGKRKSRVPEIFYLSDENLIILCDWNQIQILNSVSFRIIRSIEIKNYLDQIEFSKISKYWVQSYFHSFNVLTFDYNQFNLSHFWTEDLKDDVLNYITLSPKGDLLLTGQNNSKEITNSITLWKIEQRQKLCTSNKINDRIKILKFCPDGGTFAAGLVDGSINLYSIDISKTNFFKKQKQQSNQKCQIICVKSFSKQSFLTAEFSILQQSQIESENKSIVELFNQKGGQK